MRITENTFTQSFLLNVNKARLRMSRLQNQLTTGSKVGTVSDDPEAAGRILRLKNSVARNEKYQENVRDGVGLMSATASSLDRFADLLVEAKEILSRARNGGREPDLDTFANQIDQLITDLVHAGNAQFNGKYIFGGTETTSMPFILAPDRSGVTANPNGIRGQIEILVGEGQLQTINIDGETAFQGTQIFDTLIRIRDTMRNGQPPTAAQVDTVSAHLNHVSAQGGRAGLMLTSLEMADRLLGDREVQLAALLSADADTDYAEASMLLKREELMLDAALSTGARLFPKSLLDFLR